MFTYVTDRKEAINKYTGEAFHMKRISIYFSIYHGSHDSLQRLLHAFNTSDCQCQTVWIHLMCHLSLECLYLCLRPPTLRLICLGHKALR